MAPPLFLQSRSTDEYAPVPLTAAEQRAAVATEGRRGRCAVAAGLRALNTEAGVTVYDVAPEAADDLAAAEEVFGGTETVLDVQTHFIGRYAPPHAMLLDLYRTLLPDWWTGMDEVTVWTWAEYLTCVFARTENAMAVLTSGPGLDEARHLFNGQLAAAREVLERLGAAGRLMNHAVVHANVAGELGAMDEWAAAYRPAAWKVYTLPVRGPGGVTHPGWMLDDDTGHAFLEAARASGVRRVCAHKGISYLAPTGSPRDVGPAAAAFPDLDFLVYHSGYELPDISRPEGPYDPERADAGVDRLVASLAASGVGPGGNVYAELGSTWFALCRRPVEAAHVLGKLLLAVGEDNVVWGTDSIWYGPAQDLVDAFRVFQIPAELRERHGYPEITPALRAKILGANAARVYGVDLEAARARAATDDLAWIRAAVAEQDTIAATR